MANWVASLGCFELLNTTTLDPPQFPSALWPACHCGIGATRHLPEDCGAFELSTAGPQAPEIQVATAPVCRSWYQPLEKSGSVLTSFLSIKFCQKEATCRAAALLMETFQDWPLMVNNCPPACHTNPVNCPGCRGGQSVMYEFGSAACSFAASSAYCAQVVGTGI